MAEKEKSFWSWFAASAGGGQNAGIINPSQPWLTLDKNGNVALPSAATNAQTPEEVSTTAKRDYSGEDKFLEQGRINKSSVYSFPMELENSEMPYVVFYIYDTNTGSIGGAYDPRTKSLKTGGNEILNFVDATRQQASEFSFGLTDVALNTGQSIADSIGKAVGVGPVSDVLKQRFAGFSLQRNIDLRAEHTVVLFMPDTLRAGYSHDYDAISVTSVLGNAGFLAQAIADVKGKSAGATDPYVIQTAAGLLPGIQSSQELTNLLVFGTTGKAINPQMELLYNSPTLRTFNFDFRLVPRNQSEAMRIKDIINTFKYYSAPYINDNTSGRFYVPPARFIMEFHHRGDENSFLFKTKQCVLNDIQVDYAPNGYATHYDGSPVETKLTLSFTETTMISRNDISYSGASY